MSTLIEQRSQIADQRAALRHERAQLDEERQARLLKDFEATFFQLLHRFSEVVADLRYRYMTIVPASPAEGGGPATAVEEGRDAMRAMFSGFQASCRDPSSADGVVDKSQYASRNSDFYREWQHELGTYFRTLYHIFKFVDTSALNLGQRTRYANIARAQLSAYELSMIFYNGLWGEGLSGFRPLIEKYGILKHLKAETVLRPADLDDRDLYHEAARANYRRRLEIWNGIEPMISYD